MNLDVRRCRQEREEVCRKRHPLVLPQCDHTAGIDQSTSERQGTQPHPLYLARWRIFLRLRCRRRVRFFFHFQRKQAEAFL